MSREGEAIKRAARPSWWYTCPNCVKPNGVPKRSYSSRKAARRAAHRLHDRGVTAYRCPHNAGRWHVGHNPKDVREGRRTRHEIYLYGQLRKEPNHD